MGRRVRFRSSFDVDVVAEMIRAGKVQWSPPNRALASEQLRQATAHSRFAHMLQSSGHARVVWIAVAEMEFVALANAIFASWGLLPNVTLSEQERMNLVAATVGRGPYVGLATVGNVKNIYEHTRRGRCPDLPNDSQSTEFRLARLELDALHDVVAMYVNAGDVEPTKLVARIEDAIRGGQELTDARVLALLTSKSPDTSALCFAYSHAPHRLAIMREFRECDADAVFFLGYNLLSEFAEGVMASQGVYVDVRTRHEVTPRAVKAFAPSEMNPFEMLDAYRRIRNAVRYPWASGEPFAVHETVVDDLLRDLDLAVSLVEAQFDDALSPTSTDPGAGRGLQRSA